MKVINLSPFSAYCFTLLWVTYLMFVRKDMFCSHRDITKWDIKFRVDGSYKEKTSGEANKRGGGRRSFIVVKDHREIRLKTEEVRRNSEYYSMYLYMIYLPHSTPVRTFRILTKSTAITSTLSQGLASDQSFRMDSRMWLPLPFRPQSVIEREKTN